MKTNKSANNYPKYEKLSQDPSNEKNSFQLKNSESIGVRHFCFITRIIGFFFLSFFDNL